MSDALTTNAQLVPLRIPSGWAVLYNVYFADVEMRVENGRIVNFEAFKEDLLQLRQLGAGRGGRVLDRSGYLLDLGWYPDSDPEGSYGLAVLHGDWHDPVLFWVRSRDRQVIRHAIELICDGLERGESPATLAGSLGVCMGDL